MLGQIQKKKSMLSNWILGIFTLTLILSTINSYLFQDPTNAILELDRYHSLFKEEVFKDLHQIILKNKLGTIRFEKVNSAKKTKWNMISPRSLPANQAMVEAVIQDLKNIRIRKIHPKDPINMANFALDSPLLTITLIDKNGKKEILTQGLKKYNNETYLSLSEKESIYQVDALKVSMESLSLTNFVDSQVVSLNSKDIASLKIYKGDKNQKNLQVSMYKEKSQWKGRDGSLLEPLKVKQYVTDLSSLRSQLILDKQSEALKKKLKEYLATPLYTLELEDENKNLFTYKLTRTVSSLPDIKVEKRQNFIVTASNREHPYLVNKSFLSLFYKKQKVFKIRKAPFKKLFY